MKIKTGMIMLIMAIGLLLPAQDVDIVGTIYEPIKPRFLAVDDEQIYLAEPATVHIYRLKDFQKVTQFGKAGEGPEEFVATGSLTVVVQDKQLMVSASNKMNFYEKNGRFLRTMKLQGSVFSGNFFPVENSYVGMSMNMDEKNGMAMTINVYDDGLNKKKELRRITMNFMSGKINIFDMMRRMSYEVNRDRIFFLSDDDLSVTVSKVDGTVLNQISLGNEKIPLTQQDIDGFLSQMGRNVPESQREEMKKRFEFPDFYPPMMRMIADQNHLFLMTWKKKGALTLAIVYDIPSGKKLKEEYVPVHFADGIQPFPFAFKNGVYFAVNELPDEDEPDEVIYTIIRKKII